MMFLSPTAITRAKPTPKMLVSNSAAVKAIGRKIVHRLGSEPFVFQQCTLGSPRSLY